MDAEAVHCGALRIRRTGQDQQRAHRWDFDRMAALQQGSAERVAFLKEVDQSLSDQAEQMEKALTAPSAEDRLCVFGVVRNFVGRHLDARAVSGVLPNSRVTTPGHCL